MNKLLLETFIKEVIKEDSEAKDTSNESSSETIATWGQLRKALNTEKCKSLSKAVLKDLIAQLPFSQGLSTLQYFLKPNDLKNYIKKAYGLNGENVEDNIFKIDPEVSKIIDDDIENKFITAVSKNINNKELFPDFEPIENLDMTKLLQKFIHNNLTDKANVIRQKKSPEKTPQHKLNPWHL